MPLQLQPRGSRHGHVRYMEVQDKQPFHHCAPSLFYSPMHGHCSLVLKQITQTHMQRNSMRRQVYLVQVSRQIKCFQCTRKCGVKAVKAGARDSQ